MGANTKTKRADVAFNPIRIAEGRRVVAAEPYWNLPHKWNEAAKKDGVRRKVFCASMADLFEDWAGPMMDVRRRPLHSAEAFGQSGRWVGVQDVFIGQSRVTMADVRRRVFETIDATPWLDWILLTKRPENVLGMWPEVYGKGSYSPAYVVGGEIVDPDYTPEYHRPNVWLVTSVSDQASADAMVPELLKCRDLVPVLGLSCEPLLGPVDLESWIGSATVWNADGSQCWQSPGIDWVIVGGESGTNARPCDVAWIRSIVAQCEAARVPCFVNQVGAYVVDRNDAGFDAYSDVWAEGPDEGRPTNSQAWPEPVDVEHDLGGSRDGYQGAPVRVLLRAKKGGDPAEWPEDLRVREWPTPKGGET